MSKPPHNQRGTQPQRQQQQPPQQQQISVRRQESWSGPLPPPDVLARFNEIIPDGADRVVKMAEAEQIHRHQYENAGLGASVQEIKRGQFLGAVVCGLAIVGAVYTAYIGAWIVAGALVTIPLLGIVRAFIKPRS